MVLAPVLHSPARLQSKPCNLLICFDAFNTLYAPRLPIPRQYNDIAKQFGLLGLKDEEIEKRFITAWKEEAKFHKNYGHANGLTSEQWWTNVVFSTFKWFSKDRSVPRGLPEAVIRRFNSREGYKLFDDVQPLLQKLRKGSMVSEGCRVVIGVLTNSDDRTLNVMTSLGLRVNPLRFPPPAPPPAPDGKTEVLQPAQPESDIDDPSKILPKADASPTPSPQSDPLAKSPFDIDFVVMSYDVGHEKPARQIFKAAEDMSQHVVGTDNNQHPWRKIYIGDDFGNDCVGALVSGWHGVLVDRGKHPPRLKNQLLDGDYFEMLDRVRVARYKNLADFSNDLPIR